MPHNNNNNNNNNVFLIFLIFLSVFSIMSVNGDTNGVWNNAYDIKGGVFGSDEQPILNYSFINKVFFDNYVFMDYLFVGMIYDIDNSSYYINPSGDSNVKNIEVQSITTNSISISNVMLNVTEGNLYINNQEINNYLNASNFWQEEIDGITYTSGDVKIGNSIIDPYYKLEVEGFVKSERDFSTYLFSGMIYDWDNTSYFLNPSDVSNVSILNVEGGNIVNNCITKSSQNYTTLDCNGNILPQSMFYDYTINQWTLICCKIN